MDKNRFIPLIIAVFFFLFGLYFGYLGGETVTRRRSEKLKIDSIKMHFMEKYFDRPGYKEEELVAELENENGVRVYSDRAGDLYFVYGSTSVPDASYRIKKHSWVKK